MALQPRYPSILLYMVALAIAGSLRLITASSCTPSAHPCTFGSTLYPPTLKYYVQFHANSSALIINAVNPAVSTFGQALALAHPLTQEQNANSLPVGFIRGIEVFDSLEPSLVTTLVLDTVTYSDGAYNGTISLHGEGNMKETSFELTVVGGTGDFRGVRGYAAITSVTTDGPDLVFEHVLHFNSFQ